MKKSVNEGLTKPCGSKHTPNRNNKFSLNLLL